MRNARVSGRNQETEHGCTYRQEASTGDDASESRVAELQSELEESRSTIDELRKELEGLKITIVELEESVGELY